jgi:hypothetical protein
MNENRARPSAVVALSSHHVSRSAASVGANSAQNSASLPAEAPPGRRRHRTRVPASPARGAASMRACDGVRASEALPGGVHVGATFAPRPRAAQCASVSVRKLRRSASPNAVATLSG